jgi:hypothetical protein
MKSYVVKYKFSQNFIFPAEEAYKWCTDFHSDDWARMNVDGERKIKQVNEETILLTDTISGTAGKVTKKRLVRLFPERLFWTNTRISLDGRYSQFLYQIVSDGEKASHIDFTGSEVFYGGEPSHAEMEKIAEKLAESDASVWKALATAMEKELGNRK